MQEIEFIQEYLNRYQKSLLENDVSDSMIKMKKLLLQTRDEGKKVLIETSGSISICDVDPRAILIYDIKCPTSGMSESNLWENLTHLKNQDEVKFVVGSRQDYDWAKTIIERFSLTEKHVVLFSPVWDKLSPSQLAEWILEDGLSACLQLQLHKILWGPKTRGV